MNDETTGLKKSITESYLIAVLNRMDEQREFMVQFWLQNPTLAKQGGEPVARLLGLHSSHT